MPERLAKGLFAQKKRKGKASGESSKRAKVGTPDPVASAATDAAPEVRPGDEAVPTARVIVAEGESPPPEPASLPSGDRASDLSADKEKERRKGKAAVVKARKERPDEPSRSDNEDQGADPFGNPDIIRDLIDRFALPEEVDRLVDLDRRQFVWESLGSILRVIILPYLFFIFSPFFPSPYSDLFVAVGSPHACPS